MTASVAPLKVTPQQLGLDVRDDGSGQYDYDLGNLTVFDPSPLDPNAFKENVDEHCLDLAQRLAQSLVSRLFDLPCEPTTGGRVATLPAPTTRLPREKPIPKPAPLTKWQKFALEKGIKKRKRSKLEWDDNTQDWKRRHGYQRANDETATPIIEAKPTDKVGEDPFTALEQGKRDRVRKQNKQQTDNVKKMAKSGAALPPTIQLSSSLPERGNGKPTKRRELKGEIKSASHLAGVATASMGKFDKRLPGEKEGERILPGKKQHRSSVTDTETERTRLVSFTDKFLRERSDDVIDVKKAIGSIEMGQKVDRHAGGGGPAGKHKGGKPGKGGKLKGRVEKKAGDGRKGRGDKGGRPQGKRGGASPGGGSKGGRGAKGGRGDAAGGKKGGKGGKGGRR